MEMNDTTIIRCPVEEVSNYIMEVEWKVLSLIPGESVEWELLNGPFRRRGGYRFRAVDEGTQFTLVSDVEKLRNILESQREKKHKG